MKERMVVFLLIVLLFLLSGCIGANDSTDNSGAVDEYYQKEVPDVKTPPAAPDITETRIEPDAERLLIDNISVDLDSYYGKGWSHLYQLDELDCSRMSTYFWDYVRTEYKVAPKIIVSYERQHAWLALKVKDVGNSTKFRKWTYNNVDYYFLEATVPKIVADDNAVFVINGKKYTSAEFYNSTIYVFDTPQEANDFHADYTRMGGWNQEFRMRKYDLDKIAELLNS
ncbi:MAG: hypothetical protein OIN89_01330 [Candidatus Methanoperedens sp.]|jgi:hypothetical protein|nr:hypothetical protein [Candidatus Methanoperedens sp.]PKL54536.1 MAG: hypothetical protein CVV36_01305 [Candidatus Methanoperedenaceae archaeon HGW-Methanoperedenaceae-1]